MGEMDAPNGHLLSPNETSSSGSRLHLMELLAKGVPYEPSNNAGYCQGYCFPQASGKALLLKTKLTYLIEHGEVKLVPN